MTGLSALVVFSGGRKFNFEEKFRQKGFGLRATPSHRIEFTAETFPFDRRIDRVIFTSRNAVRAVLRPGLSPFRRSTIYAVGPATCSALERRKIEAACSPEIPSARGLAAHLPVRLDGEFIFWPRGEDADLWLAQELKSRGAEVYAPAVYRKVPLSLPGDLPGELAGGRYAAFAGTSAAAVRWLFEGLEPQVRDLAAQLPAAALGPATEGELRKWGVSRITLCPDATFESLAETILETLENLAASRCAG